MSIQNFQAPDTHLSVLNNAKQDTITSLELVKQINFFRNQTEAKAEIRHDTLLNIIRDEFGEEMRNQKLLETHYNQENGAMASIKRPMFVLTLNQAKQVLVRESKVVRKAVIQYIEELEEKAKQLVSQFKVPQTFKEALLLAVEQQDRIEKQELLILEQKPKVDFANQLLESTNGIDFATCSKAMNLPFGRNRLFEICREQGWLSKNNQPKQHLVDSGYFVVLESSYSHPKSGDRMLSFKTLITTKGQEWLLKKLRKLETPSQ
jgi:anti-repressor protein